MNIRLHKEMNRRPMEIGKEALYNTFLGLLTLYNRQDEYQDLIISKQELWEMFGFKGDYHSERLWKLLVDLTKSSTFHFKDEDNKEKTISGSMFIVEVMEDEKIKVEVPRTYQKYLFYKRDIELLTKAKNNEQMTPGELDHYQREVKPKKPYLMLLKKADILGVQGLYSKRLYALLMQFKMTGMYFENYEKFKEILEIPDSYRATNIDKRVLEPAKEELKKFGLNITKIDKQKKGRKIQKISIYFNYEEQEQEKRKEVSKEAVTKIIEREESELEKAKNTLSVEVMKSGNINFDKKALICGKLGEFKSVDEILEYKAQLIIQGIFD